MADQTPKTIITFSVSQQGAARLQELFNNPEKFAAFQQAVKKETGIDILEIRPAGLLDEEPNGDRPSTLSK